MSVPLLLQFQATLARLRQPAEGGRPVGAGAGEGGWEAGGEGGGVWEGGRAASVEDDVADAQRRHSAAAAFARRQRLALLQGREEACYSDLLRAEQEAGASRVVHRAGGRGRGRGGSSSGAGLGGSGGGTASAVQGQAQGQAQWQAQPQRQGQRDGTAVLTARRELERVREEMQQLRAAAAAAAAAGGSTHGGGDTSAPFPPPPPPLPPMLAPVTAFHACPDAAALDDIARDGFAAPGELLPRSGRLLRARHGARFGSGGWAPAL
jgi:hypothetical protein